MVSGIITLALLALFLGGWIWAWSPRRKAEFDAAARQPLEEPPTETTAKESAK